jgi:adenine deaminase
MQANSFQIRANIVDVVRRRVFPGTVEVADGRIASVTEDDGPYDSTLMPGFVDAHIHIESSMLTPCQFALAAVVHGTVATVSDPHEIANVVGVDGVRFMLDNAAHTPLKIMFGAPSCVPATTFETAGAALDAEAVSALLDDPRIGYLSEVMNFPGVLMGDRGLLAKMDAAKAHGKPIDGHAPGLRGDDAAAYVRAGIGTDHECFTKDEALDKLAAGAVIQIREGSAARNFEALVTLIDEVPGKVMLCSDDKHPDELVAGHINELARRAVALGMAPMNVIQAGCANPVHHYKLGVGLLQEGDRADFIEVNNLTDFNVLQTFIDGVCVAKNGRSLLPEPADPGSVNRFEAQPILAADLKLPCPGGKARVIGALDGQLVTECRALDIKTTAGHALADTDRDILKIVVVNRYQGKGEGVSEDKGVRNLLPAVALIQGFGLKRGAIASSVAHDSHNVIAVGANDHDLARAINLVIENRGGLSVADGGTTDVLPLPIAGLMSAGPCAEVAEVYARLDTAAKQMGSKLRAPYMTLSFMALLVIPSLKLSDKGLFDGERFEFVPVGAG